MRIQGPPSCAGRGLGAGGAGAPARHREPLQNRALVPARPVLVAQRLRSPGNTQSVRYGFRASAMHSEMTSLGTSSEWMYSLTSDVS